MKIIQDNINNILQGDFLLFAKEYNLSVSQLLEYIFDGIKTKPFLKPIFAKSLASFVERLDQYYYNKAESLVLDEEYDYIRELLNSLDPKAKAKVGASPLQVTVWPKVQLEISMGSLLKENSVEDLLFWAGKYTRQSDVCWSDKLDGSSIELTFENGQFVQGVSRGSGEIGDDLTPNVAKMQFPKTIPVQGRVKVRGEVVLHKEDWKQFFPEYKNPRNSAAGTMRRLDGERNEHLRIYGFWLMEDNKVVGLKHKMFETLQNWGFHVPNFGLIQPKDFSQFLDGYKEKRASLPYEIDGIVLEENDTAFFEELGQVDNRPRAARAYKFASLGATTKLLGIEWTVGRTGVLTPTAILEPIEVGGVTISRVMVNNIDEINRFELSPGCNVDIARQNDVIPKLKGASKQKTTEVFQMPESCPSCGSKTSFDGVRVLCPNKEECPDQTQYKAYYFLKCLDVKGAGEKVIEKLFEQGKLKTVADLYKLSVQDWAEASSGEKVALKIVQDLKEKSQKVTLPQFIKAVGFKLFSESFTEIVMEKYPTLDVMRKATVEDVVGIPRIGPAVAEAMAAGFKRYEKVIDELLLHVNIVEATKVNANGALAGANICFTGCRASSETEEKLKALGAKVVSGVSSKTTHLVVADLSSSSSKMQKAKELGLTIWDEGQLQRVLAQGL
jgi:DNA ligase (NAD+)